MDRFEALTAFVAVAERRSFAAGARAQEVPACLARQGIPAVPADLRAHQCIIGSVVRLGNTWPFGAKGETIVEVVPRLTD